MFMLTELMEKKYHTTILYLFNLNFHIVISYHCLSNIINTQIVYRSLCRYYPKSKKVYFRIYFHVIMTCYGFAELLPSKKKKFSYFFFPRYLSNTVDRLVWCKNSDTHTSHVNIVKPVRRVQISSTECESKSTCRLQNDIYENCCSTDKRLRGASIRRRLVRVPTNKNEKFCKIIKNIDHVFDSHIIITRTSPEVFESGIRTRQ